MQRKRALSGDCVTSRVTKRIPQVAQAVTMCLLDALGAGLRALTHLTESGRVLAQPEDDDECL